MRFIHTADWHLGRIFHNVHFTGDQALALDQLYQLAKDARPDFIWGPVHVYPLPYAEPPVVWARSGFEDLPDHNTAFRAVTDLVRNAHPDGARSVALAHAFVAGGEACESERPLSVGGGRGAMEIMTYGVMRRRNGEIFDEISDVY